MKLYDSKMAPNPRRVRIFLAEKGIDDIEIVPVDILKREHKAPDFLAKNPMGQIPLLELDDGTCIAESVSICRYLEELRPEPRLFGRTAVERAHVDQWLRRIEMFVSQPIIMTWAHDHPFTASVVRQNKEWGQQNRAAIPARLAWLDAQLAGKEFIAGPYSIADIAAQSLIDFAMRMLEVKVDPAAANLSAWHARVSARPSAGA